MLSAGLLAARHHLRSGLVRNGLGAAMPSLQSSEERIQKNGFLFPT
jgi:hypothetical protein